MTRWLGMALTLCLAAVGPAYGHPGRSLDPGGVWSAWTWDPWVLLFLGVSACLYARGAGRVWRRAGQGRGITSAQFACFCGGLLVVAVAQMSPLHALGGALFSAHMVQHELLILLAAPLLAMGAPQVALGWALPRRASQAVVRAARRRPMRWAWFGARHPLGAWSLHAVVLWAWHAPAAYQATLERTSVHFAQHVSFFATAVLFWYALLRLRRTPAGSGLAFLFLFTTMLHSNALGALLTFARDPWYPAYGPTAARFGFTALEDQQLGGLIMWIPAGMVYLVVGMLCLAALLRIQVAPERRPPRGAGEAPARVPAPPGQV